MAPGFDFGGLALQGALQAKDGCQEAVVFGFNLDLVHVHVQAVLMPMCLSLVVVDVDVMFLEEASRNGVDLGVGRRVGALDVVSGQIE